MPEMFGFNETKEDFFEDNGRVATYTMHPMNRGLLPDHSLEISGLGFRCADHPDGSELTLEYRVDPDDMEPQYGAVVKMIPSGLEWLLEYPEKYGLPENITLEELEQQVEAARKGEQK